VRETKRGNPSAEKFLTLATHAPEKGTEGDGSERSTTPCAAVESQRNEDAVAGIVADGTFILATRDTRYRSVAAAVSELIE
jgi:hypothetical protein